MTKEFSGFMKSFFPWATASEVEELFGMMTLKTYKSGTFFIQPGEVCKHVFFLNSGIFKFYILADGQEIIREFFSDSCFYSEYESFLQQSPSNYYLEAMEECQVFLLSYEDVNRSYAQSHTWEKFGRKIAEYLFLWLSNRISSFYLETPEERYQKLMATNPKLLQKVPQYMIASYLGITPEALSRIRKRMAEGSKIKTSS